VCVCVCVKKRDDLEASGRRGESLLDLTCRDCGEDNEEGGEEARGSGHELMYIVPKAQSGVRFFFCYTQ
jgi:hypothetical protein